MAMTIDLFIILFVILLTFIGYKRGLTKSLIKIASFILSLTIAFILFRPISMYIINETEIDDKLEEKIRIEILHSREENNEIEDKKELDKNKIPKVTLKYIEDKLKNIENNTKEVVADRLSKEITASIINICIIFIVFLLSKIIIFLIKCITNLIVKIPVINQIDKIGGVVYGLLKSLLLIYSILALISFVAPKLGNIINEIQNSTIGSYMYNNNIILKILL